MSISRPHPIYVFIALLIGFRNYINLQHFSEFFNLILSLSSIILVLRVAALYCDWNGFLNTKLFSRTPAVWTLVFNEGVVRWPVYEEIRKPIRNHGFGLDHYLASVYHFMLIFISSLIWIILLRWGHFFIPTRISSDLLKVVHEIFRYG